MKRTFVVCVDASASVEERDAYTKHLRASRILFWHHIDHLWIVSTEDEGLTSRDLHHGVREFMPNSTSIALEVQVKDYGAYCTHVAHEWLADHLKPYGELARLLAETNSTDQ